MIFLIKQDCNKLALDRYLASVDYSTLNLVILFHSFSHLSAYVKVLVNVYIHVYMFIASFFSQSYAFIVVISFMSGNNLKL